MTVYINIYLYIPEYLFSLIIIYPLLPLLLNIFLYSPHKLKPFSCFL